MKKIYRKFNIIGCLITLTVLIFGCSKDNPLNPLGDCFGGNWAEQYADELQAYSNALNAYNENPTPANCASFKTSAQNYLDALREVVDCVPTTNRAEIDQSINEAKADVEANGCD